MGDSKTIVEEAMLLITKLPKTNALKMSALYQTEPVSDIAQEPFINAMIGISTTLEPHELLLELQAIEEAYYRQRDDDLKWGPRTLDLDIILYGNVRLNDSHLSIPHPEMKNRLFVLVPLLEISGDIYISGLGSISYLINNAPQFKLQKLDD